MKRLLLIAILSMAALLGSVSSASASTCDAYAAIPPGPGVPAGWVWVTTYFRCYAVPPAWAHVHIWTGIEGYTGGPNGNWVTVIKDEQGFGVLNNWPSYYAYGNYHPCPIWSREIRFTIWWDNLDNFTYGNKVWGSSKYIC